MTAYYLTHRVVVSFSVALLVVLTGASTPAFAKGGTDILHFFVHADFTASDATPDASGTVDARQNKQGKANNETVAISLIGLDANGTYSLLISTVADTNLIWITDFNPDSDGKTKFNFRKLGNGHGNGHGKQALPAAMDPVSNIRTFVVTDVNTQTVASADLTHPTKFEYLIKRNLGAGDVSATLRIQANQKKARVRLSARGLSASSDYSLVFNDNVVETATSDSKGRLDIGSELLTPSDALDLNSVALWDSSSNVVISTTLP
jgi:hypothetical protein